MGLFSASPCKREDVHADVRARHIMQRAELLSVQRSMTFCPKDGKLGEGVRIGFRNKDVCQCRARVRVPYELHRLCIKTCRAHSLRRLFFFPSPSSNLGFAREPFASALLIHTLLPLSFLLGVRFLHLLGRSNQIRIIDIFLCGCASYSFVFLSFFPSLFWNLKQTPFFSHPHFIFWSKNIMPPLRRYKVSSLCTLGSRLCVLSNPHSHKTKYPAKTASITKHKDVLNDVFYFAVGFFFSYLFLLFDSVIFLGLGF